jgi:hypothetical protein
LQSISLFFHIFLKIFHFSSYIKIELVHIFLIFYLLIAKLLIITPYSLFILRYILCMNLNVIINGMNLSSYFCELFLVSFEIILTFLLQFFKFPLSRFSAFFNIIKDRFELILKITLQLHIPILITSFISQFLLKFISYWSKMVVLL